MCQRLLHIAGLLLVSFLAASDAREGCRAANRCCEGKDNKCRVPGKRTNGMAADTCYCDVACQGLKDCCTDRDDFCRPVDCVINENWMEWGQCDSLCGPGRKYRKREVIQASKNGGKFCPPILQTSACEGVHCKLDKMKEGDLIVETAKLISSKYVDWRKDVQFDPFKDIRRNLFHNYHMNLKENNRNTYSAIYEIKQSRPGCAQLSANKTTKEIGKGFSKGAKICVDCQATALKKFKGERCVGHGLPDKETRWTYVTHPSCHGTWVLLGRKVKSTCGSEAPHLPRFAFV